MRLAGYLKNLVLILASVLWLVSCATEVGDIDRTDPNKIRKADLKGIWYSVATVIDAPNPSPVTFNGEMNFGGGVRVIFDIQEDYLVVYPVSELEVVGAEKEWHKAQIRNYWDAGKADEFLELYVGQPVGAYRILKHFDVIRQYNSQTGEQNNVIVEDTNDQFWFEREYMRVDWTDNQVKDMMFLAALKGSPADDYVQEFEEDNPDRFEMTDGSINFVLRLFAEPVGPEGCNIYGISSYDCVGAVIKVRYSYKRLDPNNDYYPLYYPETDQQDKFGFFLTESYGYDYDHGVLLQNKVYLINRWNVWQQSRTAQPLLDINGDQIPCRDNVDCEGSVEEGKPVHCWVDDGWFSEGHCVSWDPIPFKDRQVRPIVYHKSAQWPQELARSAYTIAEQYTDSFTDMVSWLKLYSEKGLSDLRYCKTNADCAAHALVDTSIAHGHSRYCTADTDCQQGQPATQKALFTCSSTLCVKATACDASKPCAAGQQCLDGICKDGEGKPVTEVVKDTGAYTFYLVAGTGGAAKVVVSEDENLPTIPSGKALLRVVNLNADAGEVKLTSGGADLCDGQTFAAIDKERFAPKSCLVSASGGAYVDVNIVAVSDGSTVASAPAVKLNKSEVVTLVLSGDKKVPALAVLRATTQAIATKGIRLVHALPGHAGVDVSVNGGLRASDLRFGQTTGYTGMRKGDNRVTVIDHGTNGDITCYSDRGVGTCVGWRTELDADDMARYKKIREATPPTFAVCDNVFSGDACDPNGPAGSTPTGKEVVDRKVRNDCRYWWFDEGNGRWRNPCKEVPNPYEVKKHGDIRYSFVYWIGEAQAASPLGYGPSAADPDTGEIYHACANVYGADMLTYAQYGMDLLKLSTGELDGENIATADYIKEYIENNPPQVPYGSLYAGLENREILEKKLDENLAKRPPLKRFWLTPEEQTRIAADLKTPFIKKMFTDGKFAWKQAVDSLVDNFGPQQAKARMEKIKGTWIEDLLINQEVQAAATNSDLFGHSHGEEEVSVDKMSPLYWGGRDFRMAERERIKRLGEASYCMMEGGEPNVLGTALRVQEYCKDPANQVEYGGTEQDCLYWEIAQEMFEGTLLHEVGHTVGLRHNFTASSDMFNYMDPYYAIREEDYRKCNIEGQYGCLFFGQTCKLQCTNNADCYQPGSICKAVTVDGKTVKACVDEHGDYAGTCFDTKRERKYCKTDEECTTALNLNADMVRCLRTDEQAYGLCGVKAIPDTTGHCGDGLTSSNGLCLRSDTCGKGDGRCIKDAGQACKEDIDCQVSFVIWEGPEVSGPVKSINPRAKQTDNEINLGRVEYQYSSLMDYGGTINFDLLGLGKYDRAALRFGYGELVDVYTDKRHLEAALKKVQQLWSGDTIESNSEFVYDTENAMNYIFHPFLMLTDIVGVKENLSRVPAPYRKARLEKLMNLSFERGYYDTSYFIVPYKAKYDAWEQSYETYIFDIGADYLEITDHSWSKLHDYYVYDAFKRDRFGAFRYGDPMGYYSRILTRWMPPLQDAGRFYALYFNAFRAYPESRDIYFGNTMALGYLKEASDRSMQMLVNLVASPAPGSYKLATTDDGEEIYRNFNLKSGADGSLLDIPMGDGKFPFTTYYADAGYQYFSHAEWIGSFWEKIAAINILADSTSYFIGDYIGEQVDVGVGASIGFSTVYYTPLTNLFAGMIVGDRSRFAPYVDGGEFKPLDFLHPWEAQGKTRVETSIESLTMKAYLALYGYTFIPGGFDPGFLDSLFICLKGNGSCYDFPTGAFAPEVVEFNDPWSKKTYVAKTANYDPDRINAAFDLLTRMNALKAEYETHEWGESPELDEAKAKLEQRLHELVELADLIYSFNGLFGNLNY